MSCGIHFHRLTTWENLFHSLLNLTPFGITCCSLVPVHDNILFFFSFFHPAHDIIVLPYSSLIVCFFDHSLLFPGEQSCRFELSCWHSENLNKPFLFLLYLFCDGDGGNQTSLQHSRGRHTMELYKDITNSSGLFFTLFLLISKILGLREG